MWVSQLCYGIYFHDQTLQMTIYKAFAESKFTRIFFVFSLAACRSDGSSGAAIQSHGPCRPWSTLLNCSSVAWNVLPLVHITLVRHWIFNWNVQIFCANFVISYIWMCHVLSLVMLFITTFIKVSSWYAGVLMFQVNYSNARSATLSFS